MFTISEKLYQQMPTEIKELFDKLPNHGSDEVEAVFPQTKSQAGVKNLPTSNIYGGNSLLNSKTVGTGQVTGFTDSGSASRFFYCAKASKSERNAGLEGFEKKLGKIGNHGNISAGDDLSKKLGSNTPTANHHPTVKPLSLTKYLATLIKPPTGGRLLVPFSGSGSEMIGALQAGWEYVEGVELTEEYIPIAEARIKYWTNNIKVNKDGTISPIDVTKPSNLQTKVEQISLI